MTNEITASNGSAVQRVATELAGVARGQGVDALLIGDVAAPITLPAARGGMRLGRYASSRPTSILNNASQFLIGVPAVPIAKPILANGTPRTVFVHNQPWLGRDLRQSLPHTTLALYVHNRIMQRVPPGSMRRALSYFDRVVCVSAFIKGDLCKRSRLREGSCLARRVFVVGNAVDLPTYALTADKVFDVTYVGRVLRSKGVHVLLESLLALEAQGLCLNSKVVGGAGFLPKDSLTPYESHVRDLASRLRGSLVFTGPVPPSEVPGHMASSRVVVVPSIEPEASCLVVLEALASSAAVVASGDGGVLELASSGGIILVPPEDIEEMTQALAGVLRNQAYLSQLAERGQEAMRDRSWHRAYEQLREVCV